MPGHEIEEPSVVIVERPPRADPENEHPGRLLRTGARDRQEHRLVCWFIPRLRRQTVEPMSQIPDRFRASLSDDTCQRPTDGICVRQVHGRRAGSGTRRQTRMARQMETRARAIQEVHEGERDIALVTLEDLGTKASRLVCRSRLHDHLAERLQSASVKDARGALRARVEDAARPTHVVANGTV